MNNETEMRGCKRIVLSPQGIKEVIAAMEDISKWLTEYLKARGVSAVNVNRDIDK